MFNQVAVFESPKALAGEDDWGTPDELDAAFDGHLRAGPAGPAADVARPLVADVRPRPAHDTGSHGRIALLGDAAHPPLQYMAQGAIMAIEDGWVLAEHVAAQRPSGRDVGSGVDWDAALAAYDAVRPEHCRARADHRPRVGRALAPRRAGPRASATSCCAVATPTTTPTPTGSTAPRPSPRTRSRRCSPSSRCRRSRSTRPPQSDLAGPTSRPRTLGVRGRSQLLDRVSWWWRPRSRG